MSTGSPTVRRRRLGLLLRRFRNDAELTGLEVAGQLERHESWMSRLEAGRTGLRVADLRTLLDIYRVTDPAVRAEMEDLARQGRKRGWWSRYASTVAAGYATYIGFEAEASRLLVWQSLVIDGLLQTEEYARAVFRVGAPTAPAETVDSLVQVRMRRQQLLSRTPPLELWVILDEAVLHRVIGGDTAVHVRQLDHLLNVTKAMPNVRTQVVPFRDASHPGMLPAFTILEFPQDPLIVYIEGLTGEVYEEEEDAERYTLKGDDLRAAALSEPRSIELIESIRDRVAREC